MLDTVLDQIYLKLFTDIIGAVVRDDHFRNTKLCKKGAGQLDHFT